MRSARWLRGLVVTAGLFFAGLGIATGAEEPVLEENQTISPYGNGEFDWPQVKKGSRVFRLKCTPKTPWSFVPPSKGIGSSQDPWVAIPDSATDVTFTKTIVVKDRYEVIFSGRLTTPGGKGTPPPWNIKGIVTASDFAGVLTPADNFLGRSLTRFGLAEDVTLSATTVAPATPTSLGGLRWSIHSPATGGGTLTGVDDNGNAKYSAPDTPLAIVLRLTIQAGLNQGKFYKFPITIVKPDGVEFVKDREWHWNGFVSAGFFASVFLTPKDVSFHKLMAGEGPVDAFASGYWDANNNEDQFDGLAHPPWSRSVSKGNASTGCRVDAPADGLDFIAIWSHDNKAANFAAGTFAWTNIPWRYSVGTAVDQTFVTITQSVTSDDKGVCIITKGGITVTKKVNAPSNATISGTIKDAAGNPIGNVNVQVIVTGGVPQTRTAMTDAQGKYLVTGLAPEESYQIRPRRDGFTFDPRTKENQIAQWAVADFTAIPDAP